MGTALQDEALAPEPRTKPRWPGVLGMLGILVSLVMLLDQLDDLVVLRWAEEDWSRVLGSDLGETVSRAMPPAGWLIVSIIAGSTLALTLLVGSLALRRHRQIGVTLSRVWSWGAILWAVAGIVWARWWLTSERFPEIPSETWQWPTAAGVLLVLGVLLAYPVFLIYWLSRPDIRADYSRWDD